MTATMTVPNDGHLVEPALETGSSRLGLLSRAVAEQAAIPLSAQFQPPGRA